MTPTNSTSRDPSSPSQSRRRKRPHHRNEFADKNFETIERNFDDDDDEEDEGRHHRRYSRRNDEEDKDVKDYDDRQRRRHRRRHRHERSSRSGIQRRHSSRSKRHDLQTDTDDDDDRQQQRRNYTPFRHAIPSLERHLLLKKPVGTASPYSRRQSPVVSSAPPSPRATGQEEDGGTAVVESKEDAEKDTKVSTDGKKTRKSIQRRTVDYYASFIRYSEIRYWTRDHRDFPALRPDSNFIIDVSF